MSTFKYLALCESFGPRLSLLHGLKLAEIATEFLHLADMLSALIPCDHKWPGTTKGLVKF